jgi:hypothetical protein
METKKVSVNMGDVVREKNVSKAIPGLKLRDAYLNQQGELVLVFLDADRHAHTVHLIPAEVILNSGEVEFKPNEKNVEAIIDEE